MTMMGQLVDKFVSGLQIDYRDNKSNAMEAKEAEITQLSAENEYRKKKENKLYQLQAELLDTERLYVKDLEQMCEDYMPLAGEVRNSSQSFERKKWKTRKKKSSRNSLDSSMSSKRNSMLIKSFSNEMLSESKVDHSRNSDDEFGDMLHSVSKHQIRQMLGNIEDIKDYHKKSLLPKMEKAVEDAKLMRLLFESEQSKLTRKYGRYCINHNRSSIIIDENIRFFSLYQFRNKLGLRVDAQLIKPIQRLTRYHMFLNGLSKTCAELGFTEASADFSVALDAVQAAASHTNTMMWIGKMENCPLDLSNQGQLLKQGPIFTRSLRKGSFMKGRKWSGSVSSPATCHLLLFQQTLVLCSAVENTTDLKNPKLYHCQNISINQLRLRDVIEDDPNTFEVHKLEHIKVSVMYVAGKNSDTKEDIKSGLVMRLECDSEEIKEEWVRTINREVKLLRTMAKTLSS